MQLYSPQRGTMIDTPAIVVAKFGAGRVVAFSPHPETAPRLASLVASSVLLAARKLAERTLAAGETATSSAS